MQPHPAKLYPVPVREAFKDFFTDKETYYAKRERADSVRYVEIADMVVRPNGAYVIARYDTDGEPVHEAYMTSNELLYRTQSTTTESVTPVTPASVDASLLGSAATATDHDTRISELEELVADLRRQLGEAYTQNSEIASMLPPLKKQLRKQSEALSSANSTIRSAREILKTASQMLDAQRETRLTHDQRHGADMVLASWIEQRANSLFEIQIGELNLSEIPF